MKFISLLGLMLTVLSSSLWAQKTLRYEGSYYAGDKVPSEANYSYYLNERGQKVKHGTFRYAVKQARSNGGLKQRYIVNFQGDYSHGKKVGEWSYRIMSRNFDFDKEGFYYTKEISLEAVYNEGVANGEWEYKAKVTKRQLKDKQRNKWSMDQDVKDVYIKLHFNNGVLCDSLLVKDKHGYSFVTFMDKMGMIDGDVIEKGSQADGSPRRYQNGHEMRYLEKADRFVASSAQEVLQSFIKTGQPGLKVDTVSMLHTNSAIQRILLSEVFNAKLFKYQYIDGDDMVELKNNKWVFSAKTDGLKYVSLKPKLSKDESATIRRLYAILQKMEAHERALSKKRAAEPNNSSLRMKEMELQQDLSRMKALICMSKQLKTYVSPKEAVAIANQSCGQFPEAYDRMPRKELLTRLLSEAKQFERKYRQSN